MLMNANPVTGIVYVSDLTLTKGNIYFNIMAMYLDLLKKSLNFQRPRIIAPIT